MTQPVRGDGENDAHYTYHYITRAIMAPNSGEWGGGVFPNIRPVTDIKDTLSREFLFELP